MNVSILRNNIHSNEVTKLTEAAEHGPSARGSACVGGGAHGFGSERTSWRTQVCGRREVCLELKLCALFMARGAARGCGVFGRLTKNVEYLQAEQMYIL